jgi:hypothetical protein
MEQGSDVAAGRADIGPVPDDVTRDSDRAIGTLRISPPKSRRFARSSRTTASRPLQVVASGNSVMRTNRTSGWASSVTKLSSSASG